MTKFILALMLALGAASAVNAPASHADVASADAALCAYFPQWGDSVHHAERTLGHWRKHIHGTDPELRHDSASLARFLDAHPHAYATGDRWMDVHDECNPDG